MDARITSMNVIGQQLDDAQIYATGLTDYPLNNELISRFFSYDTLINTRDF